MKRRLRRAGRQRRAATLGQAAVLAFVVGLAASVHAEDFAARLGRVPVDGRTQASVQGLGRAAAELDGDRLTIAGEFSGLAGLATAANLRMGVAVAARGPVVHALTVTTATEGKIAGSVELNAEELAALKAGRLYIQIDSDSAPDGNLWGWLSVE